MTDSLTHVSQNEFASAEALVISMMRSAYPNLDLRRGTVLRDLLVRPAAAFYALEAERYDQAQFTRSLALMAETPENATTEDVNAILQNFSITQNTGSVSNGSVLVTVSADRIYSLTPDSTLVSLEGLEFNPLQNYTISSTPDTTSDSNLLLSPNAASTGFYFILPITSAQSGSEYNLQAGTSLSFVNAFPGFVNGEVYGDLVGGIDPETLDALLTRLPTAISHRSLESDKSIDGILTDSNKTDFASDIQAINVQGYGDDAQLRDKHNPHGVAMGGKVDIFIRTFFTPSVLTIEKTGTLVSPGKFSIDISATEAPGFYAVRAVTDSEASISSLLQFGDLPAIGSYDVLDVRSSVNVATIDHDIDPNNAVIETAYTKYQTANLTVDALPEGDSPTKKFKVQLYTAPRLADIQDYVDDDTVKNLKADYLVRSALVCIVNLKASVVKKSVTSEIDVGGMKKALADYINSRNFVGKLTSSELTSIMHDFDIARVITSSDEITGFQLTGVVRDAAGELHYLKGFDLNIGLIGDPKVLCTPETVVFAISTDDIYINVLDA